MDHSVPTDPKLERVFLSHDEDNSGFMDHVELQSALNELGVRVSPNELSSIIKAVDANSDGKLSLAEFASIFGAAKLRAIFNEIDVDMSGQISVAELQGALSKLGYKLPESTIKKILKKVDKDTSGEVDFDEFKEFFKYVPATSLALLAKSWAESVSVDCGSDLAPPTVSPDVPWHYAVLGGIGGVASRTLTAPLEKVKLAAQTGSGGVSILKELRSTHAALGFRGLFAGNGANCLRVFPYAGIVTLCYLSFLTLTPADNDLDPMEPVYRGSCAAAAGILGQLATYPIDVVRARLTVSPEKYSGVYDCFKSVAKEGGRRALYKGLTPTVFAVAPFLAFQMSTADALKSLCADKDIEVTTPLMMGIGGTAGIVAQTFVYPLDVLRRRMQVQGGGSAANVNVISDSTWTAMRQVVQREGARSLFAGIGATYMKVFPAVAIAMTTTKELIGYSKRNWE
ncbi:hypothetical protein TrVE_jg8832 [Triparma verrucosa]|uniref:EF-hand domain-containing protein n=1 Tax=Triparma verrucosa TaxID=1606542 RepID=A0A9W7KYI0_9STRA|nr:hypothetical protein TrVE_jg8832 [Triparma verrucosa]